MLIKLLLNNFLQNCLRNSNFIKTGPLHNIKSLWYQPLRVIRQQTVIHELVLPFFISALPFGREQRFQIVFSCIWHFLQKVIKEILLAYFVGSIWITLFTSARKSLGPVPKGLL